MEEINLEKIWVFLSTFNNTLKNQKILNLWYCFFCAVAAKFYLFFCRWLLSWVFLKRFNNQIFKNSSQLKSLIYDWKIFSKLEIVFKVFKNNLKLICFFVQLLPNSISFFVGGCYREWPCQVSKCHWGSHCDCWFWKRYQPGC